MHFLRSRVPAFTVARGALARSWARCRRMGLEVRRTVDANAGACGSIAAGDGAEMIDFRGRPVYLRRLHAEDRPLIEEFLAHIDSEDLRMRFFGGLRAVPPALLDHLLRVDDLERLALVVIGTDGDARLNQHRRSPRGFESRDLDVLVTGTGRGFETLLIENRDGAASVADQFPAL